MKTKFKIGELVVIKDSNCSQMKVDELGCITSIDGETYEVNDGNGNTWSFRSRHLSRTNKPAVQINLKTTLPTDSNERKNYALHRGCLRYFPAALAGVALTSKLGNDKHNPGEEMHHAREKSTDHGDCIIRHLIDTEDLLFQPNADVQKILNEVNQMAWRALAFSQLIHEKFGAPLAPGAKENV